MKTLSIHQPYASLIVSGWKTVENRTWKTSYRGPLAIHAAKTIDRDMLAHVIEQFKAHGEPLTDTEIASLQVVGVVVGVVDLVDCTKSPSGDDTQWHTPGHWGFVLRNPREIEPIRVKGRLGFFETDID
jgi:hypothetical protein